VLIVGLRRRRRRSTTCSSAGAWVALLTKLVSYVRCPSFVAYAMAELRRAEDVAERRTALGWRAWPVGWGSSTAWRGDIGWWFFRNAMVYGGLDVFGLRRQI